LIEEATIKELREFVQSRWGWQWIADRQVARITRVYPARREPFAVYYCDFQDTLGTEGIDLKEYQDSLLAKEYYRSKSGLR